VADCGAHRLGLCVRKERDVRDHLLIGHLVLLGELDYAIEHEDSAVRSGLEHEHILPPTRSRSFGEFL
jgi:hypothetical protein